MCNCKHIRLEDVIVKRDREWSLDDKRWRIWTRPGFYHKVCGREISMYQCLAVFRSLCISRRQVMTKTKRKISHKELKGVLRKLASLPPELSWWEKERAIASAARKIGWTQGQLEDRLRDWKATKT